MLRYVERWMQLSKCVMASWTRKRGRSCCRSAHTKPKEGQETQAVVHQFEDSCCWCCGSSTSSSLTAIVQAWGTTYACQQENVLVDLKTSLMQALTETDAVFAIQRLRTTNSALDWNGYSVYGRWLHEEQKLICGIEIDDKGRGLFCPFCVFHVINWHSKNLYHNNKKVFSIHTCNCTGDLRKC